jgi:hypothetical protein
MFASIQIVLNMFFSVIKKHVNVIRNIKVVLKDLWIVLHKLCNKNWILLDPSKKKLTHWFKRLLMIYHSLQIKYSIKQDRVWIMLVWHKMKENIWKL